jgi:SAM-dependent MidA family methyltransferase
VVFANELLDNLPFRIAERRDGTGWEVRVAVDGDALVENVVPAPMELAGEADLVVSDAPDGARVPVPTAVVDWLRMCGAALRHGRLVVVDYAASGAELVARGEAGWLRTYREHERGGAPLAAPGEQDVTIDVPLEYLVRTAQRVGFQLERDVTQAEWLAGVGLDELVADAGREWDARAHVGDLEAVRHRSRVTEGAALAEPGGLGAHRVLVFAKEHPTRSWVG